MRSSGVLLLDGLTLGLLAPVGGGGLHCAAKWTRGSGTRGESHTELPRTPTLTTSHPSRLPPSPSQTLTTFLSHSTPVLCAQFHSTVGLAHVSLRRNGEVAGGGDPGTFRGVRRVLNVASRALIERPVRRDTPPPPHCR
ncbi:unnamed protein product, partial [Pleuronectes platessa]